MSRRGFTLTEILISSLLLAALLLGGLSLSRTTLRATQDPVMAGGADTRAAQVLEELFRELRPASQATLEAVPPGGVVPEVLQTGVAYDNLRFRQAVAYTGAGLELNPPLAEDPFRLVLEDQPGRPDLRQLVLAGPERNRVLCRGVRELGIGLDGVRLTVRVSIEFGEGSVRKQTAMQRSLTLRSP